MRIILIRVLIVFNKAKELVMIFQQKLGLRLICSALLTAISNTAVAEDDAEIIEQITIFGEHNPLNAAPGSAHQINQNQLNNFKYTDIMRTLSVIPGIYIQEEDGYGLRPNIGMRGTGQNRSEKITVMEDGVLAAPAPYSSPAAYYFPTAGRMQRIEALKGGSTIQFGPRTTGGVINLLSRQIPHEAFAGKLDAALGENGFGKLHAFAGGQGDRIGAVAEIYRYQASGFRNINYSKRNSGFAKTDALAKVSIHSQQNSIFDQALEIKLKYSQETSNETYMGLTDADYNASPYSRYSASARDEMNTQHQQLQLNHIINFSDDLSLATVAYYNNFHRNWYKTSKVDGKSLNAGGIEAAANFDHRVTGSPSTLNVDVKANNRDYLSQGIQTQLNTQIQQHQLSFGLRFHEDKMDRYQWLDQFTINSNYQWQLKTAGVAGTDSNRVDSAKASAFFAQDKMNFNELNITAGFRYENVDTHRNDWGKTDPARLTAPKTKDNNFDAFLPSVAATYKITDQLLVLAGVQRGFAPASPGNDNGQAEKSWNYEIGTRYNLDNLGAEAVFFYSDYSNMHGNCTAAQGCDDTQIGNQYNAGEVDVTGLELSLNYEIETSSAINIPINLAYTFTNAEFGNSFNSSFWGTVTKGDALSYLPENQLYLAVGAKADDWKVTLAARYTDDIRTTPGQDAIPSNEIIDAKTIVDLSARYFIDNNQEAYFTVDNLFNEKYMTTRIHGSIFSGKPSSILVGYSYQF